jgi:hypothetical protein
MATLTKFNAIKESFTPAHFYIYCKNVIINKDDYRKIVVQKAHQFIDSYKQKKSIAITIDS